MGLLLANACHRWVEPLHPGGTVISVTDGDTLTVQTENGKVKIRLAGIDAPELNQPWGREARQHLDQLVSGQRVEIQHLGTDRYQRQLGRLYRDGQDLRLEMVSQGMAWVYRKYSHDPELLAAEALAIQAGRGLWSQSHPQPPWEYRRDHRRTSRPGRE